MIKKGFFTVVLILLVTLAGTALTLAVHYYKQYKILAVFPDNQGWYRKANASLVGSTENRRLVLFGDSRVSQWKPLPKIEGFQVINRGIGGETTAQMAYRFEQDVLDLDPDVLVVQAGINDLMAAGYAAGRADSIVRKASDRINDFSIRAGDHGVQVILLSVIQPARPELYRRLVWNDKITTYVDRVNQALARTAEASSNIVLLDSNRILDSGSHSFDKNFAEDALHINAAAYQRLNNKLSEVVESLYGL